METKSNRCIYTYRYTYTCIHRAREREREHETYFTSAYARTCVYIQFTVCLKQQRTETNDSMETNQHRYPLRGHPFPNLLRVTGTAAFYPKQDVHSFIFIYIYICIYTYRYPHSGCPFPNLLGMLNHVHAQQKQHAVITPSKIKQFEDSPRLLWVWYMQISRRNEIPMIWI